jgi:cytochrome P450
MRRWQVSDDERPAHVPANLAQQFDIEFFGPTEQLFPRLDALRDHGRVVWLDNGLNGDDGMWAFTRAEDIRLALQSPDLFSNGTPENGVDGRMPTLIPVALDPPEHGRYRRLLTPLFAPNVVGAMEPDIRNRIAGLIDGVVEKGSCEFVGEIAAEFPTRVFTSWMGLPEDETGRFVALAKSLGHGTIEERGAGVASMIEVLTSLIEARTAHPTDDLMSKIAIQRIDNEPLGPEELMGMALLLFLAGLDTVAAALSFSFWYLAQAPNDRTAITSGVVPAGRAVEELLRRHSFVNLPRRVTRDVDFCGVRLKEGDKAMFSLPLASRDPAEIDDPGSVRFDRAETRHFAFGAGPHRCLGSHLARIEMRVAFEEWHLRIPDYRLNGEAMSYAGGVMGVAHLPLRWP